MARKPTQQQLFAELLDRYEPMLAEAFRKAVEDLRSAADLQRVILALSRNDIAGAIEALHLDPAAYQPLYEAIQQAYNAGGVTAASTIPPIKDWNSAAVVIRFDGRNPRAEAWLRDHSSRMITRTVDDQREAVRTAMTRAMQEGVNPRTAALDIVGRVNRATGGREGGVLGLSAPQEQAVSRAKAELASSDPADLKNYLTRVRRDKRFDRTVAKAIREETKVPADVASKAVTRYGARLLQLRGEVIGKNEAFAALAEAKHEAYAQAIESGKLSASAVKKKWRHFASEHPRAQHIIMNGQTVGFDEQFVLPDGTTMRFPHDPSAPIGHTAGCHCQGDYVVDFLAGLT